MTHFAIAGLQLELQASDNLTLVLTKIRQTLLRYPWVQMVVLSELAVDGCALGKAKAMPSDEERALCDVARELGIWLVSGSLYERVEDKVYNTASVIYPVGDVVTRYRKMYPFYPYEKNVEAGDRVCTFEVPDVGTFGLSICYDMWFPETSRAMACQGAEVILHPTLTNTHDRDLELAMNRATAVQNQCYVIDVNGAGEQAVGRSLFVGPEGDILHAAGENEEVMITEVDISRVRRTRERGVMGLGQPLKSFRDAGHRYDHQQQDLQDTFLGTLGALELPKLG